MAVPKLTVPLVLEARERRPDGMGGHRVAWRPLGVVHAAMNRGAGGLRAAEAGAESVISWKITLRAFPAGDPRRPVAGQRLRMGERVFGIDAVAEEGPMGRHLTIVAREE